MSDESGIVDPSVVSEVSGVDADLTWDNVEDVAPTLETAEAGEGSDEEDSDWDNLGTKEPSEQIEVADSVEGGEDASEEAIKADSEDSETTSEDSEGEAESSEEDSKALSLDSMDEDSLLSVKVDGELQEISIKDFKNGISGEKAIAKRFSEYDVKEKEFDYQMNQVNEYINDLGNTMRNSSILDGVVKMGELTGMAPFQLKEALIKELLPEVERRYGLDENELALELQTDENKYLREKSVSENEKLKSEQASRDLNDQVRGVRETHNIDNETWDDAVKNLDANLPKDEAITPELVTQYVNFNRAEARSESIISNFDESYLTDDGVMDSLIQQVLENGDDLNDQDFAEILESALGKSKKEVANEAVDKKIEAKAKKEGKVKNQKEEVESMYQPEMNGDDEVLDWDELL